MDTFIVLVNYRTSPSMALTKGAAAVFVLAALGWPWRAAAMLGVLPAALLDATYDLIARNRYRLFRGHERCFVPRPEYRTRFLDSGPIVAPSPEVS